MWDTAATPAPGLPGGGGFSPVLSARLLFLLLCSASIALVRLVYVSYGFPSSFACLLSSVMSIVRTAFRCMSLMLICTTGPLLSP